MRSTAIGRLQQQLERDSFPRLQMGLIVALTGAAGLLCSFMLLRLGIHAMALRYPLALLGAYAFFLVLLWLWLRSKAEDYADVPDLVGNLPEFPSGSGGSRLPVISGRGGDFGGGGASASFDEISATPPVEAESVSFVGKATSSALEADEAAIPLLVVALAFGLAVASLYIVYLAPALFAEMLFDGVLSFSLYRHLRHTDQSHWLGTAFRRTALPFGLTAVFLMAVGGAMAAYAPDAWTIGEVIQYARTGK